MAYVARHREAKGRIYNTSVIQRIGLLHHRFAVFVKSPCTRGIPGIPSACDDTGCALSTRLAAQASSLDRPFCADLLLMANTIEGFFAKLARRRRSDRARA